MRRSIRVLGAAIATTAATVALSPVAAFADLDLDIPPPPPKPETAVSSHYSGTINPGRSKTWVWNNANPKTAAYHVGLSPVGATTDDACEFTVARTWYEQVHSGERKFYYTVKNIGAIACGANILLSRLATDSIGSTGGVGPGETVELSQSSADWGDNHMVGLTPSGATSSANCKFEVVGESYYRYRQGDVAQYVTATIAVKNIGSVACSADVRIGTIQTDRSWGTSTVAAGATLTRKWNNANPLTSGHLAGVDPDVGCEFAVTDTYYRQVINSDGSTEREFFVSIQNVGTTRCSARIIHTTV
jgi:hypothetical protein